MSRAIHNLLNTVLPSSVRTGLRRGAIATIPSMRHLDMQFRLAVLARNGFDPGVIYDIGAAYGEWSMMAAKLWPRAKLVAFEPNAREREALEETKRQLPQFDFRLCFLGSTRGTVRYSDSGTQTSALAGAGNQTAEMLVLDELVASGQIPAPDFMKLDVQGFELEVLRGGERALAGAQGALLEVSFVPFLPNMPLLADVVSFMDQRGFACYDVMGIFRRRSDDALVQMDLMFLKKDHPLRRSGDQ
jgi:FkbM family methyltransferase